MKDIKKGTLLGIGFTAGVAILSLGIIVNRNNQQKEELKNNLESDVQSALQYAETWWKNNEYQFGEEEEVEKTIQDLINENYIETDGIVDECGLDDKKNENGQCYGITN